MKLFTPTLGLMLLPGMIFFLLFAAIDAERDPLTVIEAQRTQIAKQTQRHPSYYIEEYTSTRFIDLRRTGKVHPLLDEYAAELDACNLSSAHVFDYSITINADGHRNHLTVDGLMADCIKFALYRIPFESLAPPSGTLVLSGRLDVENLNPFRPPTAATIAPASESVGYEKNFLNHYKNGGPSSEWFGLSDANYTTLTELLSCPSQYSLVRLEARYERSLFGDGDIQVSTEPRTPCVEQRAREHIKDIPHMLFKPDFTPKSITLKLNILSPELP